MAKSKSRRAKAAKSSQKSKKSGAAAQPAASKPGAGLQKKYIVYAVFAGLLVWAGYSYVDGQQKSSDFEALAAAGQPALSQVEVRQSEGRTHVSAGQQISYATNPPTSGPHFATWVDPGFYETAKSRSNLVHSMEHGMVVIHYDTPGDTVMETLREWTGMFTGPWSGIVSVRRAGLGEKLILTAWRRTLRLDRFDENAAAAFIDAFRGRGPENPVR